MSEKNSYFTKNFENEEFREYSNKILDDIMIAQSHFYELALLLEEIPSLSLCLQSLDCGYEKLIEAIHDIFKA